MLAVTGNVKTEAAEDMAQVETDRIAAEEAHHEHKKPTRWLRWKPTGYCCGRQRFRIVWMLPHRQWLWHRSAHELLNRRNHSS